MLENKPEKLYRGMRFDDQKFLDYNMFEGIKLPNYEKYNEQGARIVSDGQEYGIYMSDKIALAEMYGPNPRSNSSGRSINKSIILGQEFRGISMPKVGLLYEIDTKGLDIRKAKLGAFAHHQSGLGAEYLSEKDIPSQNVKIISAQIEPDLLHDATDIVVDGKDLTSIRGQIFEEFSNRESRLKTFEQDILKLPKETRLNSMWFTRETMRALKNMYGEKGALSTDAQFDLNTRDGVIKNFLRTSYEMNGRQVDIKACKAIALMEVALPKTSDDIRKDVETYIANKASLFMKKFLNPIFDRVFFQGEKEIKPWQNKSREDTMTPSRIARDKKDTVER